MELVSWFFVILAADLCAALIFDAYMTWKKPKRGRPRKAISRLAKIIPFRKAE